MYRQPQRLGVLSPVPTLTLRWGAGLAGRVSPFQLTLFSVLTLAAALMRLTPHPPNFTPLAALALLAGAKIKSPQAALCVPLAAMGMSDLYLGFHPTLGCVYVCFALIVLIGRVIGDSCRLHYVIGAALLASALFYAITNFGSWLVFYPKTTDGLVACYLAGVGFLPFTLAGDLFFSICLFGGYWGAERLLGMTQPSKFS